MNVNLSTFIFQPPPQTSDSTGDSSSSLQNLTLGLAVAIPIVIVGLVGFAVGCYYIGRKERLKLMSDAREELAKGIL